MGNGVAARAVRSTVASATTRLRPPDPRWHDPASPQVSCISGLEAELRLPRAVCAVLASRGIALAADAKRFLRPRLDQLHDPADLADGTRAAERIAAAIRSGERILVHGDYDVDGICATALYTRWLRFLGANVVPFAPHRMRDGYDFSDAGLTVAHEAGAKLIVTADCGTVAHETVRRARERGIEVIVTDHHTVGATLPDAHATVNPRRPDCSYRDKDLCGTGIAYKLCQLVGRSLGASESELDGYLDLVALATVADLVPLVGENRVLVAYGLRRLASSRVAGVRALMQVAGVAPEEVTAGKVGFVLAPRINAAGRIGESADALRLLLTDDEAEAGSLADALERTNRARQEEDARTLDEALGLLEAEYDPDSHFGVVVAADGWHPGVIGIVASRVVEHIYRPVVLIALDGDKGRGSARSIPGFHLYEALSECARLLRRFGGHRQAAGMDLARESLADFRVAFNAAARARLSDDHLRPVLRPDIELDLAAVNATLVHWLSYLGPHGVGNPGPLFVARNVMLDRARRVGDDHLKATLSSGTGRLDAIGFGFAAQHAPDAVAGRAYDALFKLELNEWQGVSQPQARLVDLRPSSS
ncbi:MAG: single-stranded-DNA-specific exonuclease RecJ [Labilithrix sp.]|nr:single-stranded-DNA-specific exonuclease RecJ [Labilithrix sp.]